MQISELRVKGKIQHMTFRPCPSCPFSPFQCSVVSLSTTYSKMCWVIGGSSFWCSTWENVFQSSPHPHLYLTASVQWSLLLRPSSITTTFPILQSQTPKSPASSIPHKSEDKCILNNSCLSFYGPPQPNYYPVLFFTQKNIDVNIILARILHHSHPGIIGYIGVTQCTQYVCRRMY